MRMRYMRSTTKLFTPEGKLLFSYQNDKGVLKSFHFEVESVIAIALGRYIDEEIKPNIDSLSSISPAVEAFFDSAFVESDDYSTGYFTDHHFSKNIRYSNITKDIELDMNKNAADVIIKGEMSSPSSTEPLLFTITIPMNDIADSLVDGIILSLKQEGQYEG